MSRVYLIAADKPLPLCDRQAERTTVKLLPDLPALKDKRGTAISYTGLQGFRVAEHTYYRSAVDILNYPIKPFQYELELELHEDDLRHLLPPLVSVGLTFDDVADPKRTVAVPQPHKSAVGKRMPHKDGHLLHGFRLHMKQGFGQPFDLLQIGRVPLILAHSPPDGSSGISASSM